MASSSLSLSLPSSCLSGNWDHDVFPSFHGKDVRTNFLSHMLKEFRNKGINTFIDNDIERGESIGPELIRAIRGSKIAIVLLSERYASSSWCLDELVEIMNKASGQMVVTIFCKVNPTDVKKQTGDFGNVFEETCQGKNKEKIETWRQALEGVATIAGYHITNMNNEAVMIEEIAAHISNKLNIATSSQDFDRFIGMRVHMKRLEPLLRLDLDEVRMIGIWGPPGIGKSTIARVLFNQVSSSFQLRAIMVNIKGNYPRPCLDEGSTQLQLQNQMLSQMLNHKDLVITHLEVAQERLKGKKVFLVLDDVDRLAQLVALAEQNHWFGPGSRVVITTEDQRVLKAHGINYIYKVDFPTTDGAFQMFCMYAFDQKYPKDGFTELVCEVIQLVGSLPLGLKVMGSYFRGMSKDEWTKTLPRLRTRLDSEIESILKFSYDALDDEDKDLFLHIACLFNYNEVKEVVEYLEKRFPDVMQRLVVLWEKSLISMVHGKIIMHELLAQLGKGIDRKQPGPRQFFRNTLGELMDDAAGRRSVISIVINVMFEETLNMNGLFNESVFEGMCNLQFLEVFKPLSHGLSYIPPKLRLLKWYYYPMTCLPSPENVEFLVELSMPMSKLEKLWEGNKSLRNLKRIDLRYSYNLKELPNLSTAISLKELRLDGCSSLPKLPSSIGNATSLQILDLTNCSSLVKLPSSIGNATNLQILNLTNCSSLVKLPSSIGKATNLQNLYLINCSSLVKLPSSIGNATNLQNLDLTSCSSLVKLPSSIGKATKLQELDLTNCTSLLELPSSIVNATSLKKLDLSGCSSLVELPSSIGNLSDLDFLGCSIEKLVLTGCSSLKVFPEISTNISYLNLSGTAIEEVPSAIRTWYRLDELILKGCNKLVSLPQLPESLSYLNALNCESLERLDCSFSKLSRKLNFANCFKLNEDARDLIIQTSFENFELKAVLPGKEIPICITRRANGGSLILNLNEDLYFLNFKASILLGRKNDTADSDEKNEFEDGDKKNNINDGGEENDLEDGDEENDLEDSDEEDDTEDSDEEDDVEDSEEPNGFFEDSDEEDVTEDSDEENKFIVNSDEEDDTEAGDDKVFVYLRIMNAYSCEVMPTTKLICLHRPLAEHLYVFENTCFIEHVTLHKLFFEFSIRGGGWEIKECGVRVNYEA